MGRKLYLRWWLGNADVYFLCFDFSVAMTDKIEFVSIVRDLVYVIVHMPQCWRTYFTYKMRYKETKKKKTIQ